MDATRIDSATLRASNVVDYHSDCKTEELFNRSFWYYTSVRTTDKILENGSFWLSNFKGMNDESESNLHKNCNKKVHALCFCNSDSEKIPMWYLYSGITGEGMRVGFTPATMRKWLKSIVCVYPVENGQVSSTPLYIGKDVELQVGWIFYKKYDGVVKYKGRYYDISDYVDGKFEQDNYFVKDYPWEYEKEFRVVIVNKTMTEYEKIVIQIPQEVLSSLKLSAAPEMCVSKNYLDLPGFKKYFGLQIKKSKLKIKMNLLKRNKDSIIESISSVIDESSASVVCKEIRNIARCSSTNRAEDGK